MSNVILPVGSSTIKKNTHSNFTLQTYLGAYLSTSNGKTASMGAWSDKFGVTATIGVAWTPGFLSWQEKGCLSLYGTVFDIGAIVDYKLRKDSVPGATGTASTTVTKDYSVKLGQIFSPGLYLVYGFPGNLPLSLGYGFQYGPGLAKIDGGNNTTVRNPVVRWCFFLAVDLPFFNISNRNRTREQ
ncbi:hypothetical protein [Paraflavitalea speifideaquila]|uniref:hypothetical protein n=1 Tax=Paraflavitalea speifideaquila TaxID=3076558 RepID=UPI0028E64948|nr:hypothetical protein [Paraflavitalea speifideiaquila]